MKDCYSSSIKLLVRRDYSTYKISKKLLEKGFEESEIEETVEKLMGMNYLNDQNYLEDRVRHYARNKKGPHYILKKCEDEKLPVTESLIHEIYETLGLSPEAMIQEHIQKNLEFNRIKINELSQEERLKLTLKLTRHLLSKGYIVQNIEQYIPSESNNEGQ